MIATKRRFGMLLLSALTIITSYAAVFYASRHHMTVTLNVFPSTTVHLYYFSVDAARNRVLCQIFRPAIYVTGGTLDTRLQSETALEEVGKRGTAIYVKELHTSLGI